MWSLQCKLNTVAVSPSNLLILLVAKGRGRVSERLRAKLRGRELCNANNLR